MSAPTTHHVFTCECVRESECFDGMLAVVQTDILRNQITHNVTYEILATKLAKTHSIRFGRSFTCCHSSFLHRITNENIHTELAPKCKPISQIRSFIHKDMLSLLFLSQRDQCKCMTMHGEKKRPKRGKACFK